MYLKTAKWVVCRPWSAAKFCSSDQGVHYFLRSVCLYMVYFTKLELVFVKHYAPNCLTLTLFDSNTA